MDDFFSMVIGSIQDYAIFTTDKNLLINCWCAGSEKVFGYQAEEVIGKHLNIIFTEEDIKRDIPLLEMQSAIREGSASDNRWHIMKDGNLFFAFGQMFPIKEANGIIVGFVKILRDLTERKMAEDVIIKHIKELEELNTHKENILAILSHDLRSPLSSIIEITDYLKSAIDEMEKSEVKQMLDILYQSSTDELNMLDYLLEWARIKYASEVFSPHMIVLREKVAKIFETLNEMAAANAVSLYNEVDEHIRVFADKKMLLSILQNLVSNAIKYNKPGGSITISADIKDEKVNVTVKDTGIGMSAEQKEKLFTPNIKKLSQARKENRGAGLGLLLIKGFLERNGGNIWVESEEGKGTTFYFTLPSNKQKEKLVSKGTLLLGEEEELF